MLPTELFTLVPKTITFMLLPQMASLSGVLRLALWFLVVLLLIHKVIFTLGRSDYKIYALSPEGKLNWTLKTNSFVNASPIVTSKDLVITGSYDGKVYALAPDGRMAWIYTSGNSIVASVTELSDGTLMVPDLKGTVHTLSPEGKLLWQIKTNKKMDLSVVSSNQGILYFVTEDGNLNALTKQRPLANGSWSSFHGSAMRWGRILTPAEIQADLAAKKVASTVALAQLKAIAIPITTTTTTTLTTTTTTTTNPTSSTKPPTTTTPPTTIPVVNAPAQWAALAGQKVQMADGQAYYPITESAAALGLKIINIGPLSATLEAEQEPLSMTVRYFNKVAYVPLADLTFLPETTSKFVLIPNASIAITRNKQTINLPINMVQLFSTQLQPEYPNVLP